MGKPKSCEKRRKYGVTWIRKDDGLWFVDTKEDCFKCGIYCGVSRGRLNDPKSLRDISATKSYWDKYVKKE